MLRTPLRSGGGGFSGLSWTCLKTHVPFSQSELHGVCTIARHAHNLATSRAAPSHLMSPRVVEVARGCGQGTEPALP